MLILLSLTVEKGKTITKPVAIGVATVSVLVTICVISLIALFSLFGLLDDGTYERFGKEFIICPKIKSIV